MGYKGLTPDSPGNPEDQKVMAWQTLCYCRRYAQLHWDQ